MLRVSGKRCSRRRGPCITLTTSIPFGIMRCRFRGHWPSSQKLIGRRSDVAYSHGKHAPFDHAHGDPAFLAMVAAGIPGIETESTEEHARRIVERHTLFVEVAHQSAAPYRTGATQSSRPWTCHSRLLLGQDVQEGLCRRRQARIGAVDDADLTLDPHVGDRHDAEHPLPFRWCYR